MGVDDGTVAAEDVEGLRGLAMQRRDIACLLADEPRSDVALERRLGRGNNGVAEALAPARDAAVGLHLDQQVVHAGKAQPGEFLFGCPHVEGDAHIVRANGGDLHGILQPAGEIVRALARMLASAGQEKEDPRRTSVKLTRAAALSCAFVLIPLGAAAPAETPKRGGILNFAVVAEPPTTDCHATTTFAMVHPVAPQYSTLLMFTGPHDNIKIEGDLAESWEVSKDGIRYSFILRQGATSHYSSNFRVHAIT